MIQNKGRSKNVVPILTFILLLLKEYIQYQLANRNFTTSPVQQMTKSRNWLKFWLIS